MAHAVTIVAPTNPDPLPVPAAADPMAPATPTMAFAAAPTIPAEDDEDPSKAFGGATQEDVLLLIALGSSLRGTESCLALLSRDVLEHTLVPAVNNAFWASRCQAGLVTPPSIKSRPFRPLAPLRSGMGVSPAPGNININNGPLRPSRIVNPASILQRTTRPGGLRASAIGGNELRMHGGALADRFSTLEASARLPDLKGSSSAAAPTFELNSWGLKRRRPGPPAPQAFYGSKDMSLAFAAVPRRLPPPL
mmetsp:Transcript_7267/g.18077  ORF Transcript_7267/g.18077 Transcript_7267/m.18077 type:complete len:250 (+) Transcript_7267:388-1137(+)